MPNDPTAAWSKKRQRQHTHIKEGLLDRGESEDTAEEIAARTVNKERAQHGEAAQASRTSTDDLSPGRRGGLRSHKGPGGRTYRQLYAEAKHKGDRRRSRMARPSCSERWIAEQPTGAGHKPSLSALDRPAPVAPPTAPGDARRRASRGAARVGCSGWLYRDWRGVVYPEGLPQRRWFEHYATLFDTVELNNTFYRLPHRETVDKWREQAPPGFLYALKLGAFGSHRMKLRDAASWLPNHLDRARRLGPALGPTLVQLPPRGGATSNASTSSSRSAPPDRCAGRWRSASRRGCTTTCSRCSTARRGAVSPRPAAAPPLVADRGLDLRPLPRAGCDRAAVRRAVRRPAAVAPRERLREWLDAGHDVYAYFNNDYDGHAVADARWLRGRLGTAAA